MLDCWSAAPPYRMNKERLIDDRTTLILLLTSPPLSLKGKAREGGLLETLAFGSILKRPAMKGHHDYPFWEYRALYDPDQ